MTAMIRERTAQQAEAEERVARGAALLDRETPDWFQRFDTEDFNIMDMRRCAVGQALNIKGLAKDNNDAVTMYEGFLRACGIEDSTTAADYGFLPSPIPIAVMERAWCDAVTTRLMGSGI